MTQAQRVCAVFPAALDDRDRLDIAVWSERKEYQDIRAQEARQVLTDPQAFQDSRDTAAIQDSQVLQGSPEERVNRENQGFQDLQLT